MPPASANSALMGLPLLSAVPPAPAVGRINLLEIKEEICRKVGLERAARYFTHFKHFLGNQLLPRVELEKLAMASLGKENICLHNQLIWAIIRNALHPVDDPSPCCPPVGISKPIKPSSAHSNPVVNDKPSSPSHPVGVSKPVYPSSAHSNPVVASGDKPSSPCPPIGVSKPVNSSSAHSNLILVSGNKPSSPCSPVGVSNPIKLSSTHSKPTAASSDTPTPLLSPVSPSGCSNIDSPSQHSLGEPSLSQQSISLSPWTSGKDRSPQGCPPRLLQPCCFLNGYLGPSSRPPDPHWGGREELLQVADTVKSSHSFNCWQPPDLPRPSLEASAPVVDASAPLSKRRKIEVGGCVPGLTRIERIRRVELPFDTVTREKIEGVSNRIGTINWAAETERRENIEGVSNRIGTVNRAAETERREKIESVCNRIGTVNWAAETERRAKIEGVCNRIGTINWAAETERREKIEGVSNRIGIANRAAELVKRENTEVVSNRIGIFNRAAQTGMREKVEVGWNRLEIVNRASEMESRKEKSEATCERIEKREVEIVDLTLETETDENVDESIRERIRRILKAPLGVHFLPDSAQKPSVHTLTRGQALGLLLNYGPTDYRPQLHDTRVLQKQLTFVAISEGLQGASENCSLVIDEAVKTLLKGLIKSCVEATSSLRSNDGQLSEDVKLNKRGWNQNEVSNRPIRRQNPISLLDFKVAMEQNPKQLRQNWPLILEKISSRLF